MQSDVTARRLEPVSDTSALKKVVFDTGIVLQAALSDAGPAFSSLRLMEQRRISVYLSPQVREEYADVLSRLAIRAKNPFLDEDRVQLLLAQIDANAQAVTVMRTYVQYSRDPKDEPILNLAIQKEVDYIVARDRDLLDLGRSVDFRLLYPSIKIVDPLTFVREMAEYEGSDL